MRELTPEEKAKIERDQRREDIIATSLFDKANNDKGVTHTLYYARAGQYGKDDEVLVYDIIDKLAWLDPTISSHNRTPAIFTSKEELIIGIFKMDKSVTFCVFKRTFNPVWRITEEEVAIITHKGIK